jgi:TonB family protein
MFEHLVESGSHKEDLSRKGSFLVVTAAIYAVLIVTFLVAGIWFTVAQLDTSDLDLITLVAPVQVVQVQKEEKHEAAKPVKPEQNVDVRKDLIAQTNRADLVPEKTTTKALDVPPVRNNVRTIQGTENSNAAAPIASGAGTGNVTMAPTKVEIADAPPPAAAKPTPHAPISGGVLNGKALSLPKPQYPAIARQAHASGTVVVQVLIDENGAVIAAHAISGHPLLQAVAVQAAHQARFSPTKLSGQPVKVNGVIQYNFVAP